MKFQQNGKDRARYGSQLLYRLAERLSGEFGKGFDASNLQMYDDLRRGPDDNPTVGIILCAQKDASVVRYSILHGNEELFATKYKLVLPTEDELRKELDRKQSHLSIVGSKRKKA